MFQSSLGTMFQASLATMFQASLATMFQASLATMFQASLATMFQASLATMFQASLAIMFQASLATTPHTSSEEGGYIVALQVLFMESEIYDAQYNLNKIFLSIEEVSFIKVLKSQKKCLTFIFPVRKKSKGH